MKRIMMIAGVIIVLLVQVAIPYATALADDDFTYQYPIVYQMRDEYLDMESASASFVVESGDTIRHTSVSLTLKNNTEQDVEFVNATLLIADKEEIDRVSGLPKYQRYMEMLRRKYHWEWYVRVEYFGADSHFPKTLKAGETETIMFFIDESIYPSDIENVACYLQVYAVPK